MSADARSYLVQQLGRIRLASNGLLERMSQVERGIKEVQADLVLVIAAVDDIEAEQAKRNVA